ncbi:hypothetical protein BGW36DRAFT_286595 [Talaromyces proteolyticus]|uniref:Zn(2)-C6 fungal-type domain-containing protein n=1 Tax=Talaromyces proteolyticus TaxID=1131652 RepID=A0AAD4KZV9_9EURO|nr:uncharacterized protein BGW36DRAFT_286595 [Talaromyces proteolyticus]KAH8704973.1 hypothetical protein BGW36DRAFT_286595 [Talaromyces proteolyticus]
MPKLAKRACDTCIARKVRCDGELPCRTCKSSKRNSPCTYVRPAQKRGPKVRQPSKQSSGNFEAPQPAEKIQSTVLQNRSDVSLESAREIVCSSQTSPPSLVKTISQVIREYENHSYSVWPVIRSNILVQQLALLPFDEPTFCLAAALCAATIAQLNIINKRTSALLFIQEAVSSAKVLGLDKNNQALQGSVADVVDNGQILFSLLWVSERGYSVHLGLRPSFLDPLFIPLVEDAVSNPHIYGLIELARLFTIFDYCTFLDVSEEILIKSEKTLKALQISAEKTTKSRLADHTITREWMRTIIWQRALSAGYLSSYSQSNLTDFRFPVVVSHDLLVALRHFSSDDLLPLGRDQLLKCFEIANTLADSLLCNSVPAETTTLRCGPYEFLHALYQKIHPFIYLDTTLDTILREKTAQALLRAPSHFWNLSLPLAMYEDFSIGQEIDNALV